MGRRIICAVLLGMLPTLAWADSMTNVHIVSQSTSGVVIGWNTNIPTTSEMDRLDVQCVTHLARLAQQEGEKLTHNYTVVLTPGVAVCFYPESYDDQNNFSYLPCGDPSCNIIAAAACVAPDTATFTPTFTRTASFTRTRTPTRTITNTLTPTATRTASPTPTFTKTFTYSPTFTATPTYTRTATRTATRTVTQTWTPTATPTVTKTATRTATPTATP